MLTWHVLVQVFVYSRLEGAWALCLAVVLYAAVVSGPRLVLRHWVLATSFMAPQSHQRRRLRRVRFLRSVSRARSDLSLVFLDSPYDVRTPSSTVSRQLGCACPVLVSQPVTHE